MSHEASDESNPCVEPASIFSAVQVQEVATLKYWYALVDPRPDPGIYRNADANGAARDVVELNIMISFVIPGDLTARGCHTIRKRICSKNNEAFAFASLAVRRTHPLNRRFLRAS